MCALVTGVQTCALPISSVLSAAAAYRLLSFRKIPYRRIALVQYSSMFINRLLPAGLGGVSLFVDFFYRHKHSLGKATAVVAVNGMLGLEIGRASGRERVCTYVLISVGGLSLKKK